VAGAGGAGGRWPLRAPDGASAWQRVALELKVWAKGKPDPLSRGLAQLEGYLEQLGLDHGVLAIFDRRPEALPIEERTRFEAARTANGYIRGDRAAGMSRGRSPAHYTIPLPRSCATDDPCTHRAATFSLRRRLVVLGGGSRRG
jgi:hypothetical protein